MSTSSRRHLDVQDAAFWFAKRRSGAMSSEDARGFDDWLASDPGNPAALKKMEHAWAVLADLEDDPCFIDVRDESIAALEARGRRGVMAIAASVAILAAGGWLLANTDAISGLGLFAPAPVHEFRTSVGQQSTVTLADGSTVTLDTDTVVRAQISHRERRIELAHGQAFFRVARDKSRPFIVLAAGKSVRATGTAFDVRVEPGRFEVTLVEGRVQVREEASKLDSAPVADMRQGWRLAVGQDARWRIEPVDLAKETAWHDGMLAFFDKPMAEAAAEMNRYSRRKLVFQGEPPATLVLGRFQAGDVAGFARAAEVNRLARVVAENETEIVLAAR